MIIGSKFPNTKITGDHSRFSGICVLVKISLLVLLYIEHFSSFYPCLGLVNQFAKPFTSRLVWKAPFAVKFYNCSPYLYSELRDCSAVIRVSHFCSRTIRVDNAVGKTMAAAMLRAKTFLIAGFLQSLLFISPYHNEKHLQIQKNWIANHTWN